MPAVGASFTIINNQGTTPIHGTFAQGSTYTSNGYTYAISYTGGTNNDSVVLTVISVPGPVTHFLVSATPSSTVVGGNVKFTVTALDGNNNVVPSYTGTVTFTSTDGQAVFPVNPYTFTSGGLTSDDGVHTFTATLETAGNQSITATDPSNNTGTLTNYTVAPDSTSTAISSSLNPSVDGQSVTFTATVSNTTSGSSAVPTGGSVTFTYGSQTLGTPTLTNGTASVTVTNLPLGADQIDAVYSGDTDFNGSTAPSFSQSVTTGTTPTTTTVTLGNEFVNSSVTYDGSPHGATASWASTGTDGGGGPLQVYYVGVGGTSYASTTSAPTDAGNYEASASFPGDAGHTGSSGVADFSINQAALTITATDQTQTYGFGGTGASLGTSAFISTGLQNGETVGAVTLTTNATTSTSGNYNTDAYDSGNPWTITPSAATGGTFTAGNYNITYDTGSLTVTPATLTVTGITAGNKVYNGATSATLAGLSSAKLTSVLPGDSVTLNTAGASGNFANKNVGTGITVTVSGLTLAGPQAADYTSAATTTANITPAPLTVTALANTKTYDGTTSAAATPAITKGKLFGTDTAGFSEAYTTINARAALTLTPSGLVNDGDGGHDYAVTFKSAARGTIKARPITVTALTNSKTYDGTISAAAVPSITSGTLVVSDTPNFKETYAAKNVGTGLTLIPSGSVSDGNGGHNYAVTLVRVKTGSITPRTLTITADASKVYGKPNPALKPTYSGFAPGDSPRVLSGALHLTTTATTGSGVGDYTITVGAGTLKSVNYTLVFVNGTLSVTPATLTVTAHNASRVYGAANPTFTATITGFVHGDSSSVVQGAASLSTPATAASGVGKYPITVSLGTLSAANYTFVFINGTLTVTKAPLTIAANNVTWTIGQPAPSLTPAITGLANGDIVTAQLSTTATASSPAGKFSIRLKTVDSSTVKALSATGQANTFAVALTSPDAVLDNYSVFYVSAVLTAQQPIGLVITSDRVAGPARTGRQYVSARRTHPHGPGGEPDCLDRDGIGWRRSANAAVGRPWRCAFQEMGGGETPWRMGKGERATMLNASDLGSDHEVFGGGVFGGCQRSGSQSRRSFASGCGSYARRCSMSCR